MMRAHLYKPRARCNYAITCDRSPTGRGVDTQTSAHTPGGIYFLPWALPIILSAHAFAWPSGENRLLAPVLPLAFEILGPKK